MGTSVWRTPPSIHKLSFAEYIESPVKEFLNKYKSFYELLANGYVFHWQGNHTYFGLNIGLTNDLAKCAYKEPF